VKIARIITRKSIVLLKNENNFLPLNRKEINSIAIIGPRAAEVLLDWYSGLPPYTVSPLEGIKERVGRGVRVLYADGSDKEAAAAAARACDVAVVCVGNHPTGNAGWAECPIPSDGKEGVDRKTITLEQEELIKEVYRANKKTVVVLLASFPFAVCWTQHHVPAILHMTHNSQELGNALAEVLLGEVSPGGRLVQTWPRSIDQLPAMMDYDLHKGRTYMYFKGEPLYPFGHGLSYTCFAYHGLRTSSDVLQKDGEITIDITVKNIGPRTGEEVVQIYIKHLNSKVQRPLKELKGFKRITLKPDEEKTVRFHLPSTALSYWDIDKGRFELEKEEIMIMVGSSSRNIRLEKIIKVIG